MLFKQKRVVRLYELSFWPKGKRSLLLRKELVSSFFAVWHCKIALIVRLAGWSLLWIYERLLISYQVRGLFIGLSSLQRGWVFSILLILNCVILGSGLEDRYLRECQEVSVGSLEVLFKILRLLLSDHWLIFVQELRFYRWNNVLLGHRAKHFLLVLCVKNISCY